MTIHERIRAVRADEKLSMNRFGERIGIKSSSISLIETGKNNPSQQTILSICREFNVSEQWLRTGEGPMHPEDDLISIDDLIQSVGISGKEAATIKKLVQMYCSLKEQTRQEIMTRFDEYFGTAQSEEDTEAVPEIDIDAEVEAYRQELLERKRAAEESEASGTAPGLLA